MKKSKLARAILLTLTLSAAIAHTHAQPASTGSGQAYPTRPIRVIVPFAPGGPTDIIGRVMAAKLTEALGQQVVIDNRAGAGGNIGMGLAARAAGDGYTFLLVSSSLMVNPSLYAKPGFDPVKDFIPITCVAASSNIITAHPSQPFRNAKELVAAVKANPGKFNYASPGAGTTPHLSGELLRLSLGIDIAHIPYTGAGPVVQAVLANQVTTGITAVPPVAPHIKAGSIRGIAVTAPKRVANLPDVPTASEVGVNGIDSDTKQGFLAPAGTPKDIVERMHREVMKLMQLQDVKERMAALGFDIVADSQQEFSKTVHEEIAKWGKAIRAAKIKVE
jgi:tripartite-type tricarboxylate transporter receptor subunit TctC